MVRKCRRAGVAEIAVMEVAQVAGAAEAMAAATARLTKRRKLNNEDLTLSSSCIQLRNHNRKLTVEDNGSKTASDSRNWNPHLDHDRDRVSTSCCSSNGSSEEVNKKINFVDLEDESVEAETSTYYSCRERRETTMASASNLEAAESDDLDSSNAKCCSSEADSRRRSTVEEKMPTESEIDDFFAEAEKQLLKQYSEKYNFDFVQEKAKEGRYEWVRLKP